MKGVLDGWSCIGATQFTLSYARPRGARLHPQTRYRKPVLAQCIRLTHSESSDAERWALIRRWTLNTRACNEAGNSSCPARLRQSHQLCCTGSRWHHCGPTTLCMRLTTMSLLMNSCKVLHLIHLCKNADKVKKNKEYSRGQTTWGPAPSSTSGHPPRIYTDNEQT
jgi:hypothetical protein